MTAGYRVDRLFRISMVIVSVVAILILLQLGERLLEAGLGPVAEADPLLGMAYASAGIALLGSGAMTVVVGANVRAGVFAVSAGLAWFGADAATLTASVPILRAFVVTTSLLVLLLQLHVVASVVTLSGLSPPIRAAVRLLDAAGIVVATVWLLAYAPFYDPRCSQACAFPQSIIDPGALRATSGNIEQVFLILSGVALAAFGAFNLVRRRALARSVRLTLAGGVVAGVGGAALAASWLRHPGAELPWTLEASLATLCVGTVVVGMGLIFESVRVARARRRIQLLAAGLADATSVGALEGALSRALDDPALTLAYPLDGEDRTIDREGSPIIMTAGSGRTTTPLRRSGSTIALVRHRDDIDPAVLIGAFHPSHLVALENERLQAILLAQLRSLRESRARIVEVADEERRRIERDLHDGAQQRLLAVAFALRLARVEADRDGRWTTAESYATAENVALAIVSDLRRLCRRIHPQVLSQAGLEAALVSLADESPIPLDVTADIGGRPPLPVETAAYQLVLDALEQATRRGASVLDVSIRVDVGQLVIETTDGVPAPPQVPVTLADRIGAVGGLLTVGTSSKGGSLRAVMPCA